MLLVIDGVTVVVPKCYPGYPAQYKNFINKTVQQERERIGIRLESVRVTRMCRERDGVKMYFEHTINTRAS